MNIGTPLKTGVVAEPAVTPRAEPLPAEWPKKVEESTPLPADWPKMPVKVPVDA